MTIKDRTNIRTLEKCFNGLWKEHTQLTEAIVDLKNERGVKGFIQRRIKLKSLYQKKSNCFYKMRTISDQIAEQEEQEENQKKVCEECKCKLDNRPSVKWGLGYVCISCDKRLRDEYE